MQRTILFSLIALLAVSTAKDACAQMRVEAGHGFGRGGYGFGRVRAVSPYRARAVSPYRARTILPYGFGSAYLPYDSGLLYGYAPQTDVLVQQPPVYIQQIAPPAVEPQATPAFKEYKWPAAGPASSPAALSTTPESETQAFAIVLKDGSTLSAVSIFASDDGLHFVDPDERHLRISMSAIDRAATLKLNRARNLHLYLPAAE